MKYYLQVLKEFFRLKWNEFKDMIKKYKLLIVLTVLIGTPLFIILVKFCITAYWIVAGICVTITIINLIALFYLNWQEAKRNVGKSGK